VLVYEDQALAAGESGSVDVRLDNHRRRAVLEAAGQLVHAELVPEIFDIVGVEGELATVRFRLATAAGGPAYPVIRFLPICPLPTDGSGVQPGLQDNDGCFAIVVLVGGSATSSIQRTTVVRTWMIWSSFLMEALLGTESKLSLLSDPPSWFVVSEAARTRSLGLFVCVGFVWGDDAGDETRGGWRNC
jgi:hypothetical protein